MKYLNIIYLSFFVSVFSKSIEDPVAKHDANQCGTYLCPTIPSYATRYLQSGCNGEFKDYIEHEITTESKTNIENINLIEEKSISKEGVNNNVVIVMGIMSGIISFGVGYFYGKRENYVEVDHYKV